MADKSNFIEIGRPGLEQSGGYVLHDFVYALRGQKGMKIYREIGDNSAMAGACLLSLKQILNSTEWRVDPWDKNDEEAVAIADFVDECRDDMDMSWTDVLSDAHTMLQYGSAALELTYKRRSGPTAAVPSKYKDGKIGWRRIALRAQETISRWQFDYDASTGGERSQNACGDITGFVQAAPPEYMDTLIPAEKFLLFRTSQERNNPEGRSMLRSAYYSYYCAKKLIELACVGAERDLAGIPYGRCPASAMGPNANTNESAAFAAFRQILEALRNNEQASVILPNVVDPQSKEPLWTLELLKSGGAKQFDVIAMIEHFELRMALAMLMDTLLLGHEKIGTQALGKTKMDILGRCLKGFLDSEASVFNRQAVPRLLKLNGMDPMKAPTIAHSGVSETDVEVLAAYVKMLADAGVDVFPDEILTRHLLNVANLPIEGRIQAEDAQAGGAQSNTLDEADRAGQANMEGEGKKGDEQNGDDNKQPDAGDGNQQDGGGSTASQNNDD